MNASNFPPSLFLCLLLPIILGAEMWYWGLDKARFLSYNTTPAEEEKALEVGVRFPAHKGFRPHGLTTRFRFCMTTYFGRLLCGWPHCVFSLPVFCLRLLPPTWYFDRFLCDHLCFFEVRVLTTFLTIVRSGLHGNSSTREHENVRFGWQNSTKKH